ncbi:hypothetical protein [Rhizobium sullae]|uniref:hypothetical protein n=1 Tax=Rhizobium sullae TaxID=50338 RepID=UPI00117AC536|nr:hypothetical protein [Rhizobium sullae]
MTKKNKTRQFSDTELAAIARQFRRFRSASNTPMPSLLSSSATPTGQWPCCSSLATTENPGAVVASATWEKDDE